MDLRYFIRGFMSSEKMRTLKKAVKCDTEQVVDEIGKSEFFEATQGVRKIYIKFIWNLRRRHYVEDSARGSTASKQVRENNMANAKCREFQDKERTQSPWWEGDYYDLYS